MFNATKHESKITKGLCSFVIFVPLCETKIYLYSKITNLSLAEVYQQFIDGILQTTSLEFVAVILGIVSVWLSKIENIWVYPTGLVNTIIYVYLSIKSHLLGEASVNVYFTVLSIYGWILWAKKDNKNNKVYTIKHSTYREWMNQLLFFVTMFVILYLLLGYLKAKNIAPGTLPLADAFASASSYTGMLLMARKKVESWIWWIITNITAIPLYFVKGYVFTSFQYVVFLIIAVMGLIEWHKKAKYARD